MEQPQATVEANDSSAQPEQTVAPTNEAVVSEETKEEVENDQPAASTEEDPDAGKTELFVANISFDTTDEALEAHFAPYGTLTKCKLMYNKGKAFIEYEAHE